MMMINRAHIRDNERRSYPRWFLVYGFTWSCTIWPEIAYRNFNRK